MLGHLFAGLEEPFVDAFLVRAELLEQEVADASYVVGHGHKVSGAWFHDQIYRPWRKRLRCRVVPREPDLVESALQACGLRGFASADPARFDEDQAQADELAEQTDGEGDDEGDVHWWRSVAAGGGYSVAASASSIPSWKTIARSPVSSLRARPARPRS